MTPCTFSGEARAGVHGPPAAAEPPFVVYGREPGPEPPTQAAWARFQVKSAAARGDG